jgi:glycerate 2-kinase
MRNILIAPDSFKGSLSALEAAETMALGVKDVLPEAHVVLMPLSDGGEGVVEVLTHALHGRIEITRVEGPLAQQQVGARWGLSADGETAIIEMAQAAGLGLVPPDRRDPKTTSTFGVGELLRAALDRGARRIIVGIGGSATNDGGSGMAVALGIRLLDELGNPVPRGGIGLQKLHAIDMSGCDARVRSAEIVVACDVRNPLVGPKGASAVYGPQKGAAPADVALLDAALSRFRDVVLTATGIDVQSIPGSGAAGGLGAGLVVFCGATLKSGIDIVLDTLHFDSALEEVDLVLTGEGKMDAQTRQGKVIAGVMRRCEQHQVSLAAVVGRVESDLKAEDEFGFAGVETLVREGVSPDDAMRDASSLVRARTAELMSRLIRTGSGSDYRSSKA